MESKKVIDIKGFAPQRGTGSKLYIETYGCQMNQNDSEVVVSIMRDAGYEYTENIDQADVILVNTCSIRDNAEQRIWGRLSEFRQQKKRRSGGLVGIIGGMAERFKGAPVRPGTGGEHVAARARYRDSTQR